jgi:hypothetical protein
MGNKMAKLEDKTGKKEYVSSRSTPKRTKDKFKDAVTGYVKSGVDAVRSTKLFRAVETAAKKAEKAGQKKRIKKGIEEYGRSRMEGLKSVSPDDIKTVYPTRGSISTTKPRQIAYSADNPKEKTGYSALAPNTSPRPKPRPKSMEEDDYGAVDRGNRAAQLEGMNYGGKVTKMNKGTKIKTDPEMERTAKALKQYQTRGPISSADRAMAGLVATAPDFGRAAAAMPKVTLRRDRIAEARPDLRQKEKPTGINVARPDLRKKEKISKRDYQPFTSSMMDEKKERAGANRGGMKAGSNRGGMKVEKKAMGGKCRGMGAATRGGNYKA